VAAAGDPDPRRDHAVVMAKFAHDCLKRMHRITKKLEIQLGPSPADLKARVGLHSGSLTGGVLRSEKARFQLFGGVSIMLLAAFVPCSYLVSSSHIIAFFLFLLDYEYGCTNGEHGETRTNSSELLNCGSSH
jgi:hypothetical protein